MSRDAMAGKQSLHTSALGELATQFRLSVVSCGRVEPGVITLLR